MLVKFQQGNGVFPVYGTVYNIYGMCVCSRGSLYPISWSQADRPLKWTVRFIKDTFKDISEQFHLWMPGAAEEHDRVGQSQWSNSRAFNRSVVSFWRGKWDRKWVLPTGNDPISGSSLLETDHISSHIQANLSDTVISVYRTRNTWVVNELIIRHIDWSILVKRVKIKTSIIVWFTL